MKVSAASLKYENDNVKIISYCDEVLKQIEWDYLESKFHAHLKLQQEKEAKVILNELRKIFPQSTRIKKLEAIYLEYQEKFEEALKIYDEILASKDDIFSMKRQIAIKKEKDDYNGAINALTEYLELYSGDVEAWYELAHLYQINKKPEMACFALEECIILDPYNHLNYLLYAQILFSLDSLNPIALAQKYYCKAALLSKHNQVALEGILNCQNWMKDKTKSGNVELENIVTKLLNK